MKKVKKSLKMNQPFIKSERILDFFHNQLVIAGVSGGADSLCLLHILHRMGIKTLAVYVNHGLRAEAEQDGLYVSRICRQWNIPFKSVSVMVQEFSQEMKIPVEEAGRILRYRQLFSIAEEQNADAVVVAHHADDQVESILMHLIRGSGLSGLRGMPEITSQHSWHSEIPLVRPLLSVWRKEIEAYCVENQITPVQDNSNFDTAFFRNRLRHELIPELETYNSGFKQGLLRTGRILQDDFDYLEMVLAEKMEELNAKILTNQVTFSGIAFLPFHISLKRMVLRKLISNLSPDLRDVDFSAVERGIQLITSDDHGNQVDLVDDLILFLDGDQVVILNRETQYQNAEIPLLNGHQTIFLKIGESVLMDHHWTFQVNFLDWQKGNAIPDEPYSVLLDADKCGNRLRLKSFDTGDKFIPCGMHGHSQKVSDVFTNMKLSRWIRSRYPILYNENEILWIPGHRIAESVIIDDSTNHVYQAVFQKQQN